MAFSVILVEDDADAIDDMEACFAQLDEIRIVKVTASSSEALAYVQELCPDAVILDLELHRGTGSGISFLTELQKLGLDRPPYILVTTNNPSRITHNTARQLGADFTLYKRQSDYSPQLAADILLAVCRTRDSRHFSCSDRHAPVDLRKRIHAELTYIQMNPKLRGWDYLTDAIELWAHGRVPNVSSVIGKKYQKSRDSVERAMQTAINKAWSTADIDTLRQHYTAHVNPIRGVPTIMEFVSYYADKVTDDDQ